MTNSFKSRDLKLEYFSKLPVRLTNLYSKLPFVASKSLEKSTEKLMKVQNSFHEATKRLETFEVGDWKYVNQKSYILLNMLSEEERQEFDCDVRKIKWDEYLKIYANGLQIYCLN